MAKADPLTALLAAPHELALRRAYAKSKACPPARRRIVEIEAALEAGAKPLTPEARAALEHERELLIARNGAAWEPMLLEQARVGARGMPGIVDIEFELGFPSCVRAYADRIANLDALAQTCCYGLQLMMLEHEHLAKLLRSPLLPRLRRLELGFFQGFDDKQVLELLRSPKLAELTALGLDNLTITPALAQQIAKLPQLRSLSLQAAPGSGSLAGPALAPLTELGQLTSLSLSGHDIDAKGLARLLDAPFVPQLESLSLTRIKLGARGCKLLGAAPLRQLRELDLCESNVGQHGVAFAGSEQLARLESLSLDAAKLGAKHLPAFLDALALPGLRTLWLSGLRLRQDGAEALAGSDALARCGVVNLGLGGNALGDDGAEVLAGAEGLAGIRRLSLALNGIRAEGIAALADAPLLTGLEQLDLRNNKIQTKGATILAGSVVASTLREIAIDHNWIGSKGATALFSDTGLAALEQVSFGYDNNFGDAGLDALSRSGIRLRALACGAQGGPEALQRFLLSPATERLGFLHASAAVTGEIVDRLITGELAPALHALHVSTTGLSAAQRGALEQRYAFALQRGDHELARL